MNPLKRSMIEDYVHNDKPIAGTVAKEWLRLLLAENEHKNNEIQFQHQIFNDYKAEMEKQLALYKPALAYYSAPGSYMALNGIPVLQDKGERATEALTGISSTSEKLPGNPEEETNNAR